MSAKQMDFDMVRKKFEIDINIKKWYGDKSIKVKYEQATMYEIKEFLYENAREGFNMINWVIDFVENNTTQKLKNIHRTVIAIKFEELFTTIKQTYFKGAFEEEQEGKKDAQNTDLIGSYIVFLSGELKQDPLYLMKNYTVEQLKFFTDGIVRNMNEKSEEGKKKNEQRALEKRNEKLDKGAIHKLLQQLDQSKCKEASR